MQTTIRDKGSKQEKVPGNFIGEVQLVTDGGCKPNPGCGAIAVSICDRNGALLDQHSSVIGRATNNRAEYKALIKGLDLCARQTRGKVVCITDSQLVVNQMTGVWRLNDDYLRELYHEAKQRESPFTEVIYQFAKRTDPRIRKVDCMVKEAYQGKYR